MSPVSTLAAMVAHKAEVLKTLNMDKGETCQMCKGLGERLARNSYMEWEEVECIDCDGTGRIIIRDENEEESKT